MQACRLRIAEAHPSQVVKAVVDPPSQCTALLLADSSCLLLPSLLDNSPPFLIAPSCTDVGFLRLRARRPAGSVFSFSSSSSSCCSSHRSAGTSSSLSEALNKPIGPRSKSVTLHESKSGDGSMIGISANGSGDGSLFLLAAMPGKGGSCTDLMAWSCKVPAFVSTPIHLVYRKPYDPFLQNNHLPAADSTVARLDVPHGLSVKIAASVNVLVVYSPSVSKVWIMSAKLSGASGMTDCCSGDRIPLSSENVGQVHQSALTSIVEGASTIIVSSTNDSCVKGNRKEESTDKRGCLHLIKCAVLDCNGPVFALHLSLQHLLLGQSGGLRVWSLWPLIKGIKSQRKKSLRKGNWIHKGRTAKEGPEESDYGEAGKRISDSCRGSTAIEGSEAFVRSTCRRKVTSAKGASLTLAEPRNGFYETDGFINNIGNWKYGISGAYPDGGIDQAGGNEAFVKQEETHSRGAYTDGAKDQARASAAFMKPQEETDASGKSLQGYSKGTFGGSNGWESKKQEAQVSRMGNGTSDLRHAVLSASKVSDQGATPEELTVPQGRNGILSCDAYNLEDWNSQHILSQSSLFSSSTGSSHFDVAYPCSASAPAPNVFCDSTGVHLLSCHSVPSTSSSVVGTIGSTSLLSETLCGLHSTNLVKEDQEGDFLSFQGVKARDKASQPHGHLTTFEQAVSIHGLSVGEFVILDSHGELHLLTLQHSASGENSTVQGGFRILEKVSLKPLFCSMRIKLLVVLPVSLQTAASMTYPASRILWISDGGHTIHVVSLPAREVFEEGMKTSLAEASHLNVIQTIFTTERISFLSALSVNTVMVLTEGSILAYSMVGT